MANSDLISDVQDFYDLWLESKRNAIKTGDWEVYTYFLRQVNKNFAKLYTDDDEEKVEWVDKVLKLVSCELKEISIKYKKQRGLSTNENTKTDNKDDE